MDPSSSFNREEEGQSIGSSQSRVDNKSSSASASASQLEIDLDQEFKDRYTEKDPDYKASLSKPVTGPPTVYPW